MKVIPSITVLAIAVKAQSGERESNGVFDRLEAQIKQSISEQSAKEETTTSDQNNNQTIDPRFISKDDMRLLQGYGCWCYFEEERGRGKPVDIFDESCKTLQDGYECIRRDAEDRGISCNVWETEYLSAVGHGGLHAMTMSQLREECDSANGYDTCQSWICRVEGWFTQNIVQHYFRDFLQPQDIYSHARGNFDPNSQCEVKPGTASEKECCGEYPIRFPFKTQGGSRGCCINKTYNADINHCCSDGSTKPVCDDPIVR